MFHFLLQSGLDVDLKDFEGNTGLFFACDAGGFRGEAFARQLLQWGPDKDPCPGKRNLVEIARRRDLRELVNLLKSELGGRRCELVRLKNARI